MKTLLKNPLAFLLLLLIAFLSACDPDEDEVIDEPTDEPTEEPEIENISFELSLNDYQDIANFYLEENTSSFDSSIADHIRGNKYFTDSIPADEFIIYLLKHHYNDFIPQSKAAVTYNYMQGVTSDLSKYTDAENITIDSSIYASVSYETSLTQYFYPEEPSAEHLPAILQELITNPQEEDIIRVSFMESAINPNIDSTDQNQEQVFERGFEIADDFEGFFSYSHSGEQEWYWQPYGDGCLTITGYNGGATANENLLISEQISLPESQSMVMNFEQAVNYMSEEYWDQLKVMITSNYNEDNPLNSEWVELPVPAWPPGDGWTFYESGDIDLTSYSGNDVRIAFFYSSTTENASTWEIGEVQIIATTSETIITGGDPKSKSVYYSFQNNEWIEDENVYYLNDAFYYEEMGWYDNHFSPNTDHEKLITDYLNENISGLLEGERLDVIFRKDNGESVRLMGISFVRKNHQWEKVGGTISPEEEHFIVVNSDGNWQSDPNESFEMDSEDYLTIIDAVRSTFGEQFIDDYATGEYYTGANAYYENFDLRISKRVEFDPESFEGLTEQQAKSEIIRRLKTAMVLLLQNKFPDAVSEVNSEQVHYTVTFESYNNDFSRSTWVADMICTETGNPPQFDLIDNTFIRDEEPVEVPE